MNTRCCAVAALCALTAGSVLAMSSGFFGESEAFAPRATPGGLDKKYVGLFFDVFNTTPSNVLANADQFAEHAPYLDGVAIGLHDVLVTAGDGSVVTAQYHQIMSPTQRWTRVFLHTGGTTALFAEQAIVGPVMKD